MLKGDANATSEDKRNAEILEPIIRPDRHHLLLCTRERCLDQLYLISCFLQC